MDIRTYTHNFAKTTISIAIGVVLSMSVGTLGAMGRTSPELEVNPQSENIAEFAQFPTDAIRKVVDRDLVNILLNDNRFSTLSIILRLTGVLDIIEKDGLFTIFAPTDEAFSKLPQTVLENLLKGDNLEQLINIMRYHVAPGVITFENFSDGEVMTVEGVAIPVEIDGNKITVQDATIIDSNIEAENGLIHIIDELIILPSN